MDREPGYWLESLWELFVSGDRWYWSTNYWYYPVARIAAVCGIVAFLLAYHHDRVMRPFLRLAEWVRHGQ